MKCLEESGIHICEENKNDINLAEYEIDSLSFVSFLILLEERLNIVIPEEYLYLDVLQSFDGFVVLLEQLVIDQTKLKDSVEQI
jgi:acyl carrier protein